MKTKNIQNCKDKNEQRYVLFSAYHINLDNKNNKLRYELYYTTCFFSYVKKHIIWSQTVLYNMLVNYIISHNK